MQLELVLRLPVMVSFKPTSQQQAILDWFATPVQDKRILVVIARAGCAKTTTAVEGIRRAPDRQKVALAFNNRIAKELQDKLGTGKDGARTFHSLGASFLSSAWPGSKLDTQRAVRIAGEICGSAPDPIVSLVRKLASHGKMCAPLAKSADDLLPLADRFDCLPDEDWSDDWSVDLIAELAFRCMERACKRDGTHDFDDQIFVPVRAKPAVPRYDLVVVDEAQDCNPARLILAQRAMRKGGRIVFIGDDRQAIYGWNGADSEILNRVSKRSDALTLPLNVTWRCPRSVVALAQTLVPDYQAAPQAPEGSVTSIQIARMFSDAQVGDFVLSRKNAPLVGVCLQLLKAGKRARIEGRDIGATLAATVRKVGKRTQDLDVFMQDLATWRDRESAKLPPDAEAKRQRLDDIFDTLEALSDGLATVAELLARIESLFSDDISPMQAITCSSVHKAKGLERDNVYVLSDTLYACRPDATDEQIAEERNIAYVAYTRPRSALYLVAGLP